MKVDTSVSLSCQKLDQTAEAWAIELVHLSVGNFD